MYIVLDKQTTSICNVYKCSDLLCTCIYALVTLFRYLVQQLLGYFVVL